MDIPSTQKLGRRGRPQTFDRDVALEAALQLFWRHGYDGVTIADLTKAMGIAAPSLYHAFGDKADLYRQALALYSAGGVSPQDLEAAPTALAAARTLLEHGAQAASRPGRPPGCMISSGLLMASPDHAGLAAEVATARAGLRTTLQRRIERDVADGTLPRATDASGLARLVIAVLQGMSVQALDGATSTDLRQVSEAALKAWPDQG